MDMFCFILFLDQNLELRISYKVLKLYLKKKKMNDKYRNKNSNITTLGIHFSTSSFTMVRSINVGCSNV